MNEIAPSFTLRRRPLAINSLMISGFIGLGVISGFAVDLLIAARFGLSRASDAYFVSVALPVVTITAIMSASQSVLVVAMSRRASNDLPSRTGEVLFPSLLNLAGLAGLFLALIGSLSSPLLIRILAPGFDTPAWQIAVDMSRILFWCAPAILAAEVLRSALYAHTHFSLGAAGYVLPGLVAFSFLFLSPSGVPVRIAWAILLGRWSSLLWLAGWCLWLRVERYRPVLAWKNAEVQHTLREFVAPLAGLVGRQGIPLAERWLGSFLVPGSVAAIGYASKIIQSLTGMVFGGLATAVLPPLSKAIEARQKSAVAMQWRWMWISSVLVSVPLGLGLALGSRPFVALFFESGSRNLGTGGAGRLAGLLAIYALSIIPIGPLRLQQSYLFAAQKASWVSVLLIVATIVTLAVDWPLMRWLGASGLGLAYTLGMITAAAMGSTLIRRVLPT